MSGCAARPEPRPRVRPACRRSVRYARPSVLFADRRGCFESARGMLPAADGEVVRVEVYAFFSFVPDELLGLEARDFSPRRWEYRSVGRSLFCPLH